MACCKVPYTILWQATRNIRFPSPSQWGSFRPPFLPPSLNFPTFRKHATYSSPHHKTNEIPPVASRSPSLLPSPTPSPSLLPLPSRDLNYIRLVWVRYAIKTDLHTSVPVNCLVELCWSFRFHEGTGSCSASLILTTSATGIAKLVA